MVVPFFSQHRTLDGLLDRLLTLLLRLDSARVVVVNFLILLLGRLLTLVLRLDSARVFVVNCLILLLDRLFTLLLLLYSARVVVNRLILLLDKLLNLLLWLVVVVNQLIFFRLLWLTFDCDLLFCFGFYLVRIIFFNRRHLLLIVSSIGLFNISCRLSLFAWCLMLHLGDRTYLVEVPFRPGLWLVKRVTQHTFRPLIVQNAIFCSRLRSRRHFSIPPH